ncbi:MAG: class I SAM-dependent methyltransferase [Wenzhouxiangella sp.]
MQELLDICRAADSDGLLVEPPASTLDGFSGNRLVGAIQRFTRHFNSPESAVYAEIGVFQGLTLLSNAFANRDSLCIGIDNFSQFNQGKANQQIVQQRMAALDIDNAQILDMDFEQGLDCLAQAIPRGKKIGVFFVDGPHDYRSQLVPLLRVKSLMAHNGVMLVDDANYPHVRQAVFDFLQSAPDYALLCEAYTPGHPANLSPDEKSKALSGWWNGVNILVHDPEHCLPRTLPPLTPGARDLHFMTHDLFRNGYAELSWELLRCIDDLVAPGSKGDAQREAMRKKLQVHRDAHPSRHGHQNTFSASLPRFQLADPELR